MVLPIRAFTGPSRARIGALLPDRFFASFGGLLNVADFLRTLFFTLIVGRSSDLSKRETQ